MSISLAVLEEVVREAGSIAMAYFKDLKNVEVKQKSPRDFVTAADVAVENFLKEALTRKYPEYGFWGEESGQSANQTNRWIVDPIDGTHSFSRGQYFWAISVALELDQELIIGAVYAPALNDYYCAEKGKGAWKNGQPIKVSSESNLADGMVATGFACLRSYWKTIICSALEESLKTPRGSGVLARQQWIYVWLRMVRLMLSGSRN